MPTDTPNIASLVQKIGAAASDLVKTGTFLDNAQRHMLIRAAEQLSIAAREPEENLYFTATQTAQNAAIRCAIGMGIFESVPEAGKSISAEELALTTAVDKQLIVRIMRACASTQMFTETNEGQYTHNPFSRVFTTPTNRDMFQQMYDFTGKGVYALPEFLASIGWRNPEDYNYSAFQFGHKTDLGLWEHLKEDPRRLKLFNSGMQSLATVGSNRNSNLYPFDKQLGGEEPCGQDEVLLVDIGGGRGQALQAIKAKFPELKGKMILEDLPNVIEDAKAMGLPDYIEPRAASFFEPQPVRGARAYHFRRIFHDWSDAKSREILVNTTSAMAPRSKVLIADTVVPEVNSPRALALQDLNMMSFGGMERTRRQWEDLLKSSGLHLVKVWSDDSSIHAMLEAVLAQPDSLQSMESEN